ncbi:cupin domain-containing protein [Salinigranum sp. GCM10025319]|uniref:cupin domain-containing protein n=1 Tax=Salinigranum sp. GCM10025319 TaxID=3252687 RepID=UPI0036102AD2
MDVVRFEELTLETVEQADVETDVEARWRAAFPFDADRPGETLDEKTDSTVVYNELDPGTRIGTHRDAVDELLFVLGGTVEAVVDGETATVEAESLAVVPAGEPHSVRNVGSEPARLVGVFATGTLDSTFETEPTVVDGEAAGATERDEHD